MLKHLICLHELTLFFTFKLSRHHLGPTLDTVKEENEEGSCTFPVFFAADEYKLSLKDHVTLFSLFFIVLREYCETLHNLLFDITIKILVVLVEAFVK